jgi:hypothetical protein
MRLPNHPSDPRPDLVSDHKYWREVLHNCWHLERKLYYLLHGIRCGGAEITLTQKSFMLLPGEWNEAEWEDIKQRLIPIRNKLIKVFMITRMGKVENMEVPGLEKNENKKIPEQGNMFDVKNSKGRCLNNG